MINHSEYELLLLGLLRKQAMHGYQIMSMIELVLSSCVDLKKPTAYFLLERMAKAGWIIPEEQKGSNRLTKKVYTITPEGEKAFQALLRENLVSSHFPEQISDFGMIFSEELDDSEVEDALKVRESQLKKEMDRVKTAPSHPGRIQWMLEHYLSSLQHELDWNTTILNRISPKNQEIPNN